MILICRIFHLYSINYIFGFLLKHPSKTTKIEKEPTVIKNQPKIRRVSCSETFPTAKIPAKSPSEAKSKICPTIRHTTILFLQ